MKDMRNVQLYSPKTGKTKKEENAVRYNQIQADVL